MFVFYGVRLVQHWKNVNVCEHLNQARNQACKAPCKCFHLPWKNVLDIVEKFWAPLRKLFAHLGVPSWLLAWPEHLSVLQF